MLQPKMTKLSERYGFNTIFLFYMELLFWHEEAVKPEAKPVAVVVQNKFRFRSRRLRAEMCEDKAIPLCDQDRGSSTGGCFKRTTVTFTLCRAVWRWHTSIDIPPVWPLRVEPCLSGQRRCLGLSQLAGSLCVRLIGSNGRSSCFGVRRRHQGLVAAFTGTGS